jgi:hypothetical protein
LQRGRAAGEKGRRDHATKALQPDRRLDDPPAGLPLRDLETRKEG